MPKGILLITPDRKTRDIFSRVQAAVAPEIPFWGVEDTRMGSDVLSAYGSHVIFLDVTMPYAWEFLDRLKRSEQYGEIPVVVMMFTMSREEWEEAKVRGAQAYCFRSYDADYFREILTALAGHIREGTLASMRYTVY